MARSYHESPYDAVKPIASGSDQICRIVMRLRGNWCDKAFLAHGRAFIFPRNLLVTKPA
jgi:hypothetical protein